MSDPRLEVEGFVNRLKPTKVADEGALRGTLVEQVMPAPRARLFHFARRRELKQSRKGLNRGIHKMAKEVVEVIYGKYSKFEVVKDSSIFSTSFFLRKDGKYHRGSFSSLEAAVEAAKGES